MRFRIDEPYAWIPRSCIPKAGDASGEGAIVHAAQDKRHIAEFIGGEGTFERVDHADRIFRAKTDRIEKE